MKRLLLIFALAASGAAHAVPVNFSSMQFDVLAFAAAGAAVDGPIDLSGDAATLPLIAVADVDTGDDLASASGIADTFFLASTAEAFSTSEFAGAVGVASFLGEFSGAGRYRLTVDFDRFDDVTDGLTDAMLAIGLRAGGADLIDTVLLGATSFMRDFSLASGLSGLLELSLVSTAEAVEGSAFNLSSADFRLQRVPEPGSFALVALSLGLLGIRRAADVPATAGCDRC